MLGKDWEQIRLPLVGTTTARVVDLSSGSQSQSGIVGIGIVGQMIVGLTVSTSKDQHFVNVVPIVHTNPLTGEKRTYLQKRPGWSQLNIPSVGNKGTAIHVWAGQGAGNKVISAFGTSNSTVYDGTTSLGSTTGEVISITDTKIGTTANLAFATNGNTAYYYPDGGALTQITDGDFPGNVAGQTITGGFVFLDGYAFIMTTSGRVYNSDNGSLANWSADSYLTAQMKPDAGIGLARYKNQIVAFGTESTEFFSNVGNPTGSPLQRTDQGFMNIGCINNQCYKEIDDTVVWVGATAESKLAVYMLDGLQAKRISNETIESILAAADPANMYLNAQTLFGKTFIFITSNSDSQTYVYSVETEVWSEMTGASLLWHHMAGIGTGVRYVYAVSENTTDGSVYYINPVNYVFTDFVGNYTVRIQTNRFDTENNNWIFFDKIRIIGDKYTLTNNITLYWSDDDYQTFTAGRTVDLSSHTHYVTACGRARRRAFKIVQSNTMPLRLEALTVDIRKGIH